MMMNQPDKKKGVYRPRTIKRHRRTKAEVAEESERDGLLALAGRIDDIVWANMIEGTA